MTTNPNRKPNPKPKLYPNPNGSLLPSNIGWKIVKVAEFSAALYLFNPKT